MSWNINSYPTSVQIGAHDIKVKTVEGPIRIEGNDTIIGNYIPTKKEIICSHMRDMSSTTFGENFVHEVMEAANDINDLGLSHQTITTLASSMFQAFSSGKVNFGTNVAGSGE